MGELLATTSSRELAEWEAFFDLEYEQKLQARLDAEAAAALDRPRRRR